MNQLSQSYATGQSGLLDVPVPTSAPRDGLLIRTAASVVSVGTEKAMIDVAKKSLVGKALAHSTGRAVPPGLERGPTWGTMILGWSRW